MKLSDILGRAAKIKQQEAREQLGLPENPSIADFRRVARDIGQQAKEVQNTMHHWSDDQWRKISQSIEKLER